MKQPSPDHPITTAPQPRRVRVVARGQVIANTTHAVELREASYRPVQYIPRADVRMDLLERTSHTSHCPYKGDAAYFSIRVGDHVAANAVWSYEEPFPAVADIKDRLAFHPERVDTIEVLD
ncbi:MAG: DUF427 domain-containing protein [Geminicoccaceae bacterium]